MQNNGDTPQLTIMGSSWWCRHRFVMLKLLWDSGMLIQDAMVGRWQRNYVVQGKSQRMKTEGCWPIGHWWDG